MPELHFKSDSGYKRNLAYRHIHGISNTADKVVVAGKEHAVQHSTDPKRVKIDNAQRKKEGKEGPNYNYKRHWSQVKTGKRKK